jgi:hypothetical protein
MGYRGKVVERERARDLRAGGWALADIAAKLGVGKSSVSVWVRDVEFEPQPRRAVNRESRRRHPNALQRRKHEEIERLLDEGRARIGALSERDVLVAGAALYAGEGTKGGSAVRFANTDPRMVALFCHWLRRCFTVDERRLRVRVYLHEGLDLDAATEFWSRVTGVPAAQFGTAYRAKADATIRHNKHEYGCCTLSYSCSRTHRAVMGLVTALLSWPADPG